MTQKQTESEEIEKLELMEQTAGWDTSLKGKFIREYYRIDYKAAQGGMSWLYKVTHTLLQEEMALKILYPQLCEDPRTRKRFIDEAKIQFRLQHKNIVRVTEIIQEKKLLGIIQEWVNGIDLKSYMKACPDLLSQGQIWGIFKQLLEALHYAHEQGIVHRDMKPSNILLAQDKETGQLIPKLTDFGVAKLLGDMDDRTATGMMIGTIKYVPPEQIKESKNVDRRADIYSLGVMLFQLLTGRFPFSGKFEKLLYQHLFEDPVAPSSINPSISPDLDEVVLRCLEKEPESRYQSVSELLEVMNSIMPAPEPLPPVKIKRPQPDSARTYDASVSMSSAQSPQQLQGQSETYGTSGTDASSGERERAHQKAMENSSEWLSDMVVSELFRSREMPNDGLTDTGSHLSRNQPSRSTNADDSLHHVQNNLIDRIPSLPEDRAPALTNGGFDEIQVPKNNTGKIIAAAFVCVLFAVGGWLFLGGNKGSGKKTPIRTVGATPKSPNPGTSRAAPPAARPKKVVTPAAGGSCKEGETRACYSGPAGTQGKGPCKAGQQTCKGGKWGACQGATLPQKEVCNGKDDNCDGKIDDAFPRVGKSCRVRNGGCHMRGTWKCSGNRVRCRNLRSAARSGRSQVRLKMSPSGTKFRIRAGRSSHKARRGVKVTITSSRYQMCVFRLRSLKRSMRIKMKGKSDLEDVPNYCIR